MNILSSYRGLCLLGFLGCAGGLLIAIFFFQKYLGLEPCPMCICQRVAMLAAGLIFLLGALHGPQAWGRWVYGGGAALASVGLWSWMFPGLRKADRLS